MKCPIYTPDTCSTCFHVAVFLCSHSTALQYHWLEMTQVCVWLSWKVKTAEIQRYRSPGTAFNVSSQSSFSLNQSEQLKQTQTAFVCSSAFRMISTNHLLWWLSKVLRVPCVVSLMALCRYPSEPFTAAVLKLHRALCRWSSVFHPCLWHHAPDATLWWARQENGERQRTISLCSKLLLVTDLTMCVVLYRTISFEVISAGERTTTTSRFSGTGHWRKPSLQRSVRSIRRKASEEHQSALRSPFLPRCPRVTWECLPFCACPLSLLA